MGSNAQYWNRSSLGRLDLDPFSILWGGFAIFWEAGVLGYWGDSARKHTAPSFFAIWGIPFVIAGQYFIWGRFLTEAWLKRKTYYGVTNRRVLIVQEGWKRKIRSCYLESIYRNCARGKTHGHTAGWVRNIPIFAGRGSAEAHHEPNFCTWTSSCSWFWLTTR